MISEFIAPTLGFLDPELAQTPTRRVWTKKL
jgi:hypothetical protein